MAAAQTQTVHSPLWKTSSGGFAHNKCIAALERMPVDAKLICRPSYGCSSPSFLLRMKWEITASGRTSPYVPSKRERPPNFTKRSSQTSLRPLVMSQPTQKQTLSQQKKTALKQRYPRSEIMVRPQSAAEDSAKKIIWPPIVTNQDWLWCFRKNPKHFKNQTSRKTSLLPYRSSDSCHPRTTNFFFLLLPEFAKDTAINLPKKTDEKS